MQLLLGSQMKILRASLIFSDTNSQQVVKQMVKPRRF